MSPSLIGTSASSLCTSMTAAATIGPYRHPMRDGIVVLEPNSFSRPFVPQGSRVNVATTCRVLLISD
jgi:hypothetical protein